MKKFEEKNYPCKNNEQVYFFDCVTGSLIDGVNEFNRRKVYFDYINYIETNVKLKLVIAYN